MVSATYLFLGLLNLLLRCSSHNNYEDHLIEFEDSNLLDMLSRSKYSLIYFYSDGCSYCAQFDPHFQYLSIVYNNLTIQNPKEFQVIKTNGRKNEKLRTLFNVVSYPTLKLLNFETKKITTYDSGDRDPENIIDFISRETTEVLPNFANFESSVQILNDTNFKNIVENSESNILTVFTMKYMEEWKYYQYPSHFYQSLASSYLSQNSDLVFSLVDVSSLANFSLISRYGINNFPSMVYFKKDGSLKTFRINSQNRYINNKLDREDIEFFLDELDYDDLHGGKWHANLTSLRLYQQSEEFFHDNLPVLAFGFNINSPITYEETNLEDEYNELLLYTTI